jgi:hypothetical protein
VTSRLPRARLIQGVPGQDVLYVVYGNGVHPEEVQPVVRQMNVLRGVQARVVMGSLDDPGGKKVAVVVLTFQLGVNRREAMSLLKRLANPELPVAIRLIQVVLLMCRCNYISSGLGELRFYPGLGPDDVEAFKLRYYAGMRELPVARLFSAEPQPPYGLLTDGIETVLDRIGARATMLEILQRPDRRPCTHPH